MPLLYALLVAVFLIALIVSLVFAAKYWHPLHITAVALVFLVAIPAVYCMGFVMKTRASLVKVAKRNAEDAEKAKTDYDAVLYGSEPGAGGGYGDGSRNAALARLERLNIGKGRTWENASIAGANDTQVTFAIPQSAPAEGAEAEAQPDDTSGYYPSVGSRVFVFLATGLAGENGQQIPIPGNYLGVFQVDAVGDQQITTTAELVMAEIGNGSAVYIYEKPPTDFHGNMTRALGLEDSKPSIDKVREEFAKMFPIEDLFADNSQASQDAYNQLLDEVSFDQRPISEIDEWLQAKERGNWEPDPKEVMVRVKVLEDMPVQVNGNQDILVNGDYDSLGRTNVPRLKLANDEATVKKSKPGDDTDYWMVDEYNATLGYTQNGDVVRSLQEEGIVQPIDRFYYRPLRDYTTEISQRLLDLAVLERRVAEYDRYTETYDFLLEKAQAQEVVRDEQISQLTADQQNLKKDLDSLTSFTADMESKLARLKQQMRETYLQITYIHQQSKSFEALVPPPAPAN